MEINNTVSTAQTIQNNPSEYKTSLDVIAIKKGHLVLRSLNHKLRQQIIALLEQNNRLTVTEIYVKLRIEQSVASQHLAIMRKAGYLQTFRDGKNVYYSINKTKLATLLEYIGKIIDQ